MRADPPTPDLMMVGVRRIAVVLAIARRPLMISLRSLTVGFRTLWRVVERRPYDHAFRVDLTEALARAGELTVVVCFAQAAGLKDWYLVRDDAELAVVLGRIPAAGAWGYSDRIEAYATREFAYRGTAADSLRAIAVGLLQEKGEVLLAERLDGDPRLCDAEATDEVGYIDGWFAAPRKGELLVGAHPFRHDGDRNADVLIAYNAGADGTIRPGAY